MLIALIDDHPLFVTGFGTMLAELRPQYLFRAAPSAASALEMLATGVDVSVVLVDVQLPGSDGFAAVATLKAVYPDLPCVMISGRDDPAARTLAARAGASAYIVKAEDPDAMLARIEAVVRGDEGSVGGLPACPALSERQTEVLALLAQGYANKEIRHRLGIAERTVRAHLTAIFIALNVTSRVQAVIEARNTGLIP